jgi:hypothetical protein
MPGSFGAGAGAGAGAEIVHDAGFDLFSASDQQSLSLLDFDRIDFDEAAQEGDQGVDFDNIPKCDSTDLMASLLQPLPMEEVKREDAPKPTQTPQTMGSANKATAQGQAGSTETRK